MSEKDGGPAFPGTDYSYSTQGTTVPTRGMTLRDWFAGQALVGVLANIHTKSGGGIKGFEEDTKHLAFAAYLLADAMLKERDK